jgi:hypothetical protein
MSGIIRTDSLTNSNTSNLITQTNSTTITIGSSGQTVSLASGAKSNIYNGTINWSSTIYSTNFNAVSGVGYFFDTTAGPITATLPASPSFGDVVAFKDWGSTAQTNKLTISRNGSLIEGNATDAFINNHGIANTMIYSGATRGWQVIDSGDVDNLQLPGFIIATGGTILTCGNYKTHIFTAGGCFVVTCAGNDLGSNSVEYMVVAGGASGGTSNFSSNAAGGGGAGGFRQNYPSPSTTGLPVTATTYPVTIGAGGSSNPTGGRGNSGSNSIFSTITSAGGGAGAGTYTAATSGGSGGGAMTGGPGGPSVLIAGSGNTPPVSPPQGNPGGNSPGAGFNGSGGGASAAGTVSSGPGAAGGIGSYWPNPAFGPTAPSYGSTGPVSSVRYFAGGGGAGAQGYTGATPTGGTGGSGGGGAGGNYTGPAGNPGTAGTTNTGGGGGGGSNNDQPGTISTGGSGGSGIVVIRYKYQ